MKSKNYSKSLIGVMGLLLAGLVVGCGSGGDGGGGATAQPGTLGVSLTDAPACGYDEVNVTVSKVRVHQSDNASENASGWTEITLNPARTINLLNLNDPTQPNFALDNLGETSLAAGHYTQLRLVLVDNNGIQPTANWIVLSDKKAVQPLETPSAIRSGIKLIHQFDVASGQRVDLLLDFDACKSIVKTGNGKYILKPVINVIPYVLNGIEGFVDPALLGNNVVVSAQRNNGEIVRATVPNTSTDPNKRGKFFLARLPEGVYYDVVITARNSQTDTCCATAVITGVPVPSSTSITTISTGGTPFTLQPSTFQAIGGTGTLKNPALIDRADPVLDDGTVIVAAKQSLSGGPTVTVKPVVATVLDAAPPIGDYGYNMTLPIAAPWRGLYSTTLPIVLSATVPDQSTVAKLYTILGSAQVGTTVYATQTPLPSAKDITIVDNQTQDFTLTP